MAVIDRIKYDSPTDDVLVWKFPSEEIRIGSQLIVNQSQEAILFKSGQALDIFGPGTHTLSTGNIPLLRKLINLPFGGETPFTAEVWYVNKIVKRDLNWGTSSPIPVIDPVYNFPVSVRAYGLWGMRVDDTRSFITQIVGTLSYTDTDRIEDYFSGEILQKLSDSLAKIFTDKKLSIFQANSKLNELSKSVELEISKEFNRFGVEIINFNVENINIPKEEKEKFQEVLGRRMEIEQISQAQVGQAYTTMRTFDTLEKAAESEGGAAGNLLSSGLGLGLGLGAGVPVGQELGKAMSPQAGGGESKAESNAPEVKLEKLKQMLDKGLISQEDYDAKKKEILDRL